MSSQKSSVEPSLFKAFRRGFPPLSARVLGLFIIVFGILLFVYNSTQNQFFFHDDAFISLRYAMNFVALGDLSWNPGDKVEGYTNFLHLISVAELMRSGVDPVFATRIVNTLGALLLVGGVTWGAREIAPDQTQFAVRMLGVAGVLSSVSVPVWILGGLETVLVAGFLACAVALLLPCFSKHDPQRLHRCIYAGIFFALAYLTRPDAVIMTAMAGLGVLGFGRAGLGRRLLQCVIIGAIPATVLVLHMLWRINYYGDLMPNTFYAKVGIEMATRLDGIVKYVLKAGIYYLPAVSLGLGSLIFIFLRRNLKGDVARQAAFLTLCIIGHGAYVVWSGGDHMPAARVLVGLLGPGCLLLVAGVSQVQTGLRPIAICTVLAGFLVGPLLSSPFKMNPAAYIGLVVGNHIDKTWPDDAVIALNTAGSTPFSAPDRNYIDMLGLNHRGIAKRENVPIRTARQSLSGHSKGDGKIVLDARPDYIILGPAEGRDATDPWFLSDIEIIEDQRFAQCYEKQVEILDYSMPEAATIRFIDNPLTFTYFKRVCEGS